MLPSKNIGLRMSRRSLLSRTVGLSIAAALRGAGNRIPLGANVILPGASAISTIEGQAGYREQGQGGIPGQGCGVDYRAYIAEVNKAGVPLMLEHFNTNEEFQQGAQYIRKTAAELGVSI